VSLYGKNIYISLKFYRHIFSPPPFPTTTTPPSLSMITLKLHPRFGSWCSWMVVLAFVMVTGVLVCKGLWHAMPMRTNTRALANHISYRDVLRRCKTGDIVLYSGNSSDSSIVRAWGWCSCTHVGIVVKGKESSTEAWLWESNLDETKPDGLRDGKSRGPEGGPQLTDLEVSLKAYDGLVFWRPLGKGIELDKVLPVVDAFRDHTFNKSSMDLIFCCGSKNIIARALSWVMGGNGGAGNSKARFCSELVSYMLWRAGAMKPRCVDEATGRGALRWAATTHPEDYFVLSEKNDAMPWTDTHRPNQGVMLVVQ